MMTRKEAKKKTCPVREFTANFAYHNGYIADGEELEHDSRCLAENCPKWRNTQVDKEMWCLFVVFAEDNVCVMHESNLDKCAFMRGTECDDEMVMIDAMPLRQSFLCNQCPHRYGYCGG